VSGQCVQLVERHGIVINACTYRVTHTRNRVDIGHLAHALFRSRFRPYELDPAAATHGDLAQFHTVVFSRPVEMFSDIASGTLRKAGVGNYEAFIHVDNEEIRIPVIEFGLRIGKYGKCLATFLFQQPGSLMHIGDNGLRGFFCSFVHTLRI